MKNAEEDERLQIHGRRQPIRFSPKGDQEELSRSCRGFSCSSRGSKRIQTTATADPHLTSICRLKGQRAGGSPSSDIRAVTSLL